MEQSKRSFFSADVGGVVVDKLLFRFSICEPVLEIFAIKVESCQKSRKILDNFFAQANFWGRCFQKLYPVYQSRLAARRLKNVLWGYSQYPGPALGMFEVFGRTRPQNLGGPQFRTKLASLNDYDVYIIYGESCQKIQIRPVPGFHLATYCNADQRTKNSASNRGVARNLFWGV